MALVEGYLDGRERLEALQWLLADPLYQVSLKDVAFTYPKSPVFATVLIRVAVAGALCRRHSPQVQALGTRARELELFGKPAPEVHAWFKQEMKRLRDLEKWVEDAAVRMFEETQPPSAKRA